MGSPKVLLKNNMCGIATIFAYGSTAPSIDRMELRCIRDHMLLRGPDGLGEWFSGDQRVGMAHRRLSIIDLSDKAAQPMQSEDGSLSIVFNGEIYNYQDLRKNLEQKGYVFKSHSDTEVLLHLYQEKGEGMVRDLRGMFAFALWDAQKKAMLLVRDPYGIKPLYYADDGQTLRVASQVKALLAGGHVSSDPEPAGIVGFFLTGSVPEPFTMYQEIRQVPAGSFVRVNDSGPSEPEYYASISKIFSDAAQNSSDVQKPNFQDQVREALIDSIKHHLVSDVPVGAFLSAGIDSGALIGLIHDLGIKNLETVTIAFDEFRAGPQDEAPLAEKTSRLYGTRHHTRIFTNAEFKSDLDHFFEAMDQPTIDGVNTYFASKATREIGLKVALSGLGGDELFGGYHSFQHIPNSVRTFSIPSRIPFLGEVFRHSYSSIAAFSSLQPKLGGLMKYGGTCAGAYLLQRGLFMPWELETVLDKDLAIEGMRKLRPLEHIQQAITPDPKNWFGRVAALEASLYMRNQLLRDADWSGMAHSLEIRTPFVDFQLLKELAPILISKSAHKISIGKKQLLSGSLRKPLPKAVLQRTKSGFFTPIGAWMKTEPEYNSWRRIPSLVRKDCPWARRWAYVVMEKQKMSSLRAKRSNLSLRSPRPLAASR